MSHCCYNPAYLQGILYPPNHFSTLDNGYTIKITHDVPGIPSFTTFVNRADIRFNIIDREHGTILYSKVLVLRGHGDTITFPFGDQSETEAIRSLRIWSPFIIRRIREVPNIVYCDIPEIVDGEYTLSELIKRAPVCNGG